MDLFFIFAVVALIVLGMATPAILAALALNKKAPVKGTDAPQEIHPSPSGHASVEDAGIRAHEPAAAPTTDLPGTVRECRHCSGIVRVTAKAGFCPRCGHQW